MIEFNGSITEENQLNRMKKVDKTVICMFFGFLIVMWGILIALELIFSGFWQDLWKEYVVGSVIMLVVIFLIVKTPKEIVLRFRLSPHIIITEEKLSVELWKNGEKVWRNRKLSRVKKVLDCGEVYYIIFKFGDITNSWVCQKDNIVNGTIGDFETLFQSKIVREIK
ncbi:MAG: hypothetical protein J6A38_03000 [Clostridia bacterium]|nr:hypothetical protein [Clostridia bacterium]